LTLRNEDCLSTHPRAWVALDAHLLFWRVACLPPFDGLVAPRVVNWQTVCALVGIHRTRQSANLLCRACCSCQHALVALRRTFMPPCPCLTTNASLPMPPCPCSSSCRPAHLPCRPRIKAYFGIAPDVHPAFSIMSFASKTGKKSNEKFPLIGHSDEATMGPAIAAHLQAYVARSLRRVGIVHVSCCLYACFPSTE
jgi:hypothetical protein